MAKWAKWPMGDGMGEQGSGAVASKTKELPRRDDGVEIAVSLDRPRQIAVVHQDRPRRHSGPERKACYPVGDFVLYLAPAVCRRKLSGWGLIRERAAKDFVRRDNGKLRQPPLRK